MKYLASEEERSKKRTETVKRQCLVLGVSSAEIIRRAKISRSVFHSFLTGGNTTTKNLEKIAVALEVEPEEIL